MGKQWFERILSLLADDRRAAEITGDLQEQYSNDPRFWWAALQVLGSFLWRPIAGVLGAEVALILTSICFSHSWLQAGAPMMRGSWRALSLGAMAYGHFTWSVACLALAKFGVRSPLAAAACTVAAIDTLVSCSFSIPELQVAGMIGFTLIVGSMLSHRSHRCALVILTRSVFGLWLAEAGVYGGYFATVRQLHLTVTAPQHLTIFFVTCALSMLVGWLALGRPPGQIVAEANPSRALADK